MVSTLKQYDIKSAIKGNTQSTHASILLEHFSPFGIKTPKRKKRDATARTSLGEEHCQHRHPHPQERRQHTGWHSLSPHYPDPHTLQAEARLSQELWQP